MGMPQQIVYTGTKAALAGIAKVWATELGKKYGITVSCVSLEPVATDMWTECEPDVVVCRFSTHYQRYASSCEGRRGVRHRASRVVGDLTLSSGSSLTQFADFCARR